MKFPLVCILAFACFLPLTTADEPLCSNDITQLWIDIVCIIDQSSASSGVLSSFEGMFANIATKYTNDSSVKATRVSIVGYADNVTVYAENNITSYTEYIGALRRIKTVNQTSVNLLSAMRKAIDILNSYTQANRRQVLIIGAAAYKSGDADDTVNAATQFKENGHVIITLAANSSNINIGDTDIGTLSSPGYNFTSSQGTSVVTDLRFALTESNCFCPVNYIPHRLISQRLTTTCVYVNAAPSNWQYAQKGCQILFPGTNISVLSDDAWTTKDDFLVNIARYGNYSIQGSSFHIGLYRTDSNSNNFQWLSGATFDSTTAPWAPNEPRIGTGNCVISESGSYQWKTISCTEQFAHYFCQKNACDAENYCSIDDVSL